ncbi:glutamyl-tRNA reductase [Actinotalea subterranea]|uniref:glutamyl-tRNA reductase n=1 Tax=Actinotalea subterranea TaxID=2607497 RepID=UPI001FE591F7|nr:glutamyl-tRNA reductase [Actinotalea subterranea]
MTLTASHRDLDLDVLEQLSSGAHSVAKQVVSDSPAITGCVVLATCNRFEVYLETTQAAGDAAAVATEAVARASGLPHDDVVASLQPRTGPEVARHLFAVASGLDSMVLGEREVAGQVRRALETARLDGTTSATLERLFQRASRTSRAVGSRTPLGSTGRSVVGVALDIAAHDLHAVGLDLAHACVLLIGTGSYAGATLTALRARGVSQVCVHSPSGRAEQFAADRGIEAVPPGGLGDHLSRADIVVSCSGALGPVVDAPMVTAARARHRGPAGAPRPMLLVDLALRHDIDPTVAHVPGVRLIDLATVQAHSPHTVSPAVDAGLLIVEESAQAFEDALAEQAVVPAVVALRSHVEQVLGAEVTRLRARGADDATVEQVERSLRRFAAAMLHGPTVRARASAHGGHPEEYRAAVEMLFGIDVPRPPAP